MAFFSITGYRRTSDGIEGSWQPDIPDGIGFSSISGDTTRSVARLRLGLDSNNSEADPSRLAIVRTEEPVMSSTAILIGEDIDGPLTEDGRYLIGLAVEKELPPGISVRRAIRELLNSWDDSEPDKPDRIRPNRRGRITARLGPDVIEDRGATRAERTGRSHKPSRVVLP